MLEARIRKQRRSFTLEAEFAVETGGALGIFGASGAGKSTLLACLAGIETPDAGAITLDGLALFPVGSPLHRRPVGYLTQAPNLFPHLNVAQNVGFGVQAGADADWLGELRTRLHLDDCWQAPATAISAGQARRVALARMLARRPKLVLLDEPFAGLDRARVRGLLQDLVAWRAALGFTLLAVDHQAEVLERLAPRVIALDAGRIAAQGSWEELRAGADARLRGLLEAL
jgi:ABC-type sulfate/molybdate transport systems ATPase subunit